MSNKKNPRRSGQRKAGGYAHRMFAARFAVGLGADHDGGRRGSARDVREQKTQDRRKRRRAEDEALRGGKHEE